MAIVRGHNYRMGFRVNGAVIPDPSGFSGKVSALDSEGSRDANGTLHRKMVATKRPLKLEYKSITYATMRSIMSLMTGESFQFTYPDPAGGSITIKAYVGDRDWNVLRAGGEVKEVGKGVDSWENEYFGDLSFSVIEY